jgi:hypothetical protein
MRSNAGMANRQGETDLRKSQVSASQLTFWLGLARLGPKRAVRLAEIEIKGARERCCDGKHRIERRKKCCNVDIPTKTHMQDTKCAISSCYHTWLSTGNLYQATRNPGKILFCLLHLKYFTLHGQGKK